MKSGSRKSKELKGTCKHCRRKIHLCNLANKWFHDHNFMTLCFGTVYKDIKGERVQSPKAEPRKK